MEIYSRWSTSFDALMWNVGVWRSVEIHKILCSNNNPFCEWHFTWTEEEFREIHGILHFSALSLYLQGLAKTVFVCSRFCEVRGIGRWHFFEVLWLRGRPSFYCTPSPRTGSPVCRLQACSPSHSRIPSLSVRPGWLGSHETLTVSAR